MSWYQHQQPIQGAGGFGPDDDERRRRRRHARSSVAYTGGMVQRAMPPLEQGSRPGTPAPPERFHADQDPAPVDDRLRMQPRRAHAVDMGDGPQQFATPARVLQTEDTEMQEEKQDPSAPYSFTPQQRIAAHEAAAQRAQPESAMSRDEKGAFLKLAQHDPEKPDAPWEEARPANWSENVGFGVDASQPQARAGAPYVDKERPQSRGTWDPAVQPWMVTPSKTAPEMPEPSKPSKPDPDDEPFRVTKPKKVTGRGDPVDFRPAHERASGQTAQLRADVAPRPYSAAQKAEMIRRLKRGELMRDIKPDLKDIKEEPKKEPKKERKVRFTPGLQTGPSRPVGPVDTRSILRREKRRTIKDLQRRNRGLLADLAGARTREADYMKRGAEEIHLAGQVAQRARQQTGEVAARARQQTSELLGRAQHTIRGLQTQAGHATAHGMSQVEEIQRQRQQLSAAGADRARLIQQGRARISDLERQVVQGRTPRPLQRAQGEVGFLRHPEPQQPKPVPKPEPKPQPQPVQYDEDPTMQERPEMPELEQPRRRLQEAQGPAGFRRQEEPPKPREVPKPSPPPNLRPHRQVRRGVRRLRREARRLRRGRRRDLSSP